MNWIKYKPKDQSTWLSSQLSYVKIMRYYTWHPVKADGKWKWFKWVWKRVDERPLVYQGLCEQISYHITPPKQ